jgi:hypothetical protein
MNHDAATATDRLAAMCHNRGRKELQRLLDRLTALVPIVRQQRREANRAAEEAYWSSDIPTAEAKRRWGKTRIMAGGDFCRVPYKDPDTPEYRELLSIGLAVAAFGGDDAVDEIGWALTEDRKIDGAIIWSEWDGRALALRG